MPWPPGRLSQRHARGGLQYSAETHSIHRNRTRSGSSAAHNRSLHDLTTLAYNAEGTTR
jgi:hypothetical protein